MATGGISEIAGFMCLAVHRPTFDDDDRAGPGLLRTGTTTNCVSLLYDAVRAGILVGLSNLRLRPRAIVGSAHDLGRDARPGYEHLRYSPTVISFCPSDIRTSRSTTSQPLKLSSAARLLSTVASPAFRDARRAQ